MPSLCPLCALDERTTDGKTPDGRAFASCDHPSHGTEPYVWELYQRPAGAKKGRASDGLGAELEIWDKLLDCLEPGEPLVSYGIVEDRFLEQYPNEWETLVARYGHAWRYPDRRSGQYSVSVFLASRLRELVDDGTVEVDWLPATGEWAYNGKISHWRRP